MSSLKEQLDSLNKVTEKAVKEISSNWKCLQEDESRARKSLAWFTTGGDPAAFTPAFLAFLCGQLTELLISFETWDSMSPEQRDNFVFQYVMDMNVEEFSSRILATALDIALNSSLVSAKDEGLWLYPWHVCVSVGQGSELDRVAMLHRAIFNLLSQGAVIKGKGEAFRALARLLDKPGLENSLKRSVTFQLAWDLACVALCLRATTGEKPGRVFVEEIVTRLWYDDGKEAPASATWANARKALPDLFAPSRGGKRLSREEKERAVVRAVKNMKKISPDR